MLGDDELGQTLDVVAVAVFLGAGVVFGTVDEADHIGILLDGSRLTQVGELRPLGLLAVLVVATRLDATVQLRQGDDGYLQLLGQLLERPRYGAHLLLTAAERHAAGVHQLQVVDDDDFDAVLAYQPAGFGPQLEYRQTGGLVDVDGGILQNLDARHEALPLEGAQLSALDFVARNIAGIDDETVHQLDVRHLEREDGHRGVVVDRHVLGHGEDEGGLTHGGAGGDDNQVGVLPPRGDFVDVVESGLQTAQTVGTVGCHLYLFDGFAHDGGNLHHILFQVALRNLEEFPLGLLHEVVDVVGFVECLVQDFARKLDQLAGQVFLGHDACMILDVCRRGHPAGQLRDAQGTAYLVEFAVETQLLGDGEHVDRALLGTQLGNGAVNGLVVGVVEALGFQDVAHGGVGILLEHEGSQHGLFELGVLGLYLALFRDFRGIGFLLTGSIVSSSFHISLSFEMQRYIIFVCRGTGRAKSYEEVFNKRE